MRGKRLSTLFLAILFLLASANAFADKVKPEGKVEKPAVAVKEKSSPKIDWKDKLPAKEDVAQYMQDISVTIKSSSGEGSGVVKTRVIKAGDKEIKVNLVWTAAHVVDDLRSIETVVDPHTGTERKVVKFKDASVVKELVENGRRVGELKMDAQVIKYNEQQDLALLMIRKTNFVDASVIFYLEEKIPAIGTNLFHVGSLLGQMGSNSMTSGIVSQIGRIIDKKEFDQTTATAFPGSSGGGVFLTDGAYMGMITRGAGEGFNLAIPVRRIRDWAKSAKVLWALDDNEEMPTMEELNNMPVEDTGYEFAGSSKASAVNAETPIPHPDVQPVGNPHELDDLPTLFKITPFGQLPTR